jgi:NitT/TauT family transport system ATP-binding protein
MDGMSVTGLDRGRSSQERNTDAASGPAARPSTRLTGMLRRLHARFFKRFSARHLLVPSRAKKGEAKIAIRRVEHMYDAKGGRSVVALRNVNVNVHAGEFVCLLGPSGCGKTTLLYALAGQVEPTDGRITIDGKEVKGPGPDRFLMFQEPALFPWLTVQQNLVFALRERVRTKRQAEERAAYFIRRVHLEGFERHLPHQLSGGMRMRVSLARALSMDPAVLLMDEPFGALDAQTRSHMHQLLQEVWMETRKTVVFVTHDVREALVLADRVVVMAARPGRVLEDLEVLIPRPRDPDNEMLVTLSRQIREALQRAEPDGEPASPEREIHAALDERAPAGGVPVRVADPLGGGG